MENLPDAGEIIDIYIYISFPSSLPRHLPKLTENHHLFTIRFRIIVVSSYDSPYLERFEEFNGFEEEKQN